MSYSKEQLATYRMERSKESLEEAKILAATNHWNTVANRTYYACFYIAPAYLILNNYEASTHNGIKTGFNKALISSGKLDKSFGQFYNSLFNIRQDADYRDFKDLKEEKVKLLIEKVKELVNRVESLIEDERFIPYFFLLYNHLATDSSPSTIIPLPDRGYPPGGRYRNY